MEFSINSILGYIILIFITVGVGYYIIKNRKDKRIVECLIILLPLITYYLIISKNAPYLDQRYIFPVLPIIALGIVMLVDYYIRDIKISNKVTYIIEILVIISISLYGMKVNNPEYLYTGYKECVKLADDYKEYQFIYVGSNQYNHLKNLPEFYRYKESLILNDKQIEVLENRNIEDEFIICIKNYLDIEKVLNQVMEKTGTTKYELLLECKAKEYEANYYLIKK